MKTIFVCAIVAFLVWTYRDKIAAMLSKTDVDDRIRERVSEMFQEENDLKVSAELDEEEIALAEEADLIANYIQARKALLYLENLVETEEGLEAVEAVRSDVTATFIR